MSKIITKKPQGSCSLRRVTDYFKGNSPDLYIFLNLAIEFGDVFTASREDMAKVLGISRSSIDRFLKRHNRTVVTIMRRKDRHGGDLPSKYLLHTEYVRTGRDLRIEQD